MGGTASPGQVTGQGGLICWSRQGHPRDRSQSSPGRWRGCDGDTQGAGLGSAPAREVRLGQQASGQAPATEQPLRPVECLPSPVGVGTSSGDPHWTCPGTSGLMLGSPNPNIRPHWLFHRCTRACAGSSFLCQQGPAREFSPVGDSLPRRGPGALLCHWDQRPPPPLPATCQS